MASFILFAVLGLLDLSCLSTWPHYDLLTGKVLHEEHVFPILGHFLFGLGELALAIVAAAKYWVRWGK